MKHLLLLFALCLSLQTNAQWREWERDPKATGPFIWTGNTRALNLQIRGLPGYLNLSGADVTIVSRKDTIALQSAEYGIVYCDELLADSVWIKVSCAGYETLEGKIKSRSGYEVYLKEKNADKKDVGANDGAFKTR